MGGVAWTEEEDHLLKKCIEQYGEGKWHRVPLLAGLNRCRKSCRLRWLNYLRPNIKRGRFTDEEVELIVKLHKLLGNRWSLIAGRLPGRTANDVKNFWNCHLSKKLNTTTLPLDNNNNESNENHNNKMQQPQSAAKTNNVDSASIIKVSQKSSSSSSSTSKQPKSIIGATAAAAMPPSVLGLQTTTVGYGYDHHISINNNPDHLQNGVAAGTAIGGGILDLGLAASSNWLANKVVDSTTSMAAAAAFHTQNNLQHVGDGMNLQLGGTGGFHHTTTSSLHKDHNKSCKELQVYDQYDNILSTTFVYGGGGDNHDNNRTFNHHHQQHNHGMVCSVYGGHDDHDHHQFVGMDDFDFEEIKMYNHDNSNHTYYYDQQGKSKWDLDDLVMDMDLWGTSTTDHHAL